MLKCRLYGNLSLCVWFFCVIGLIVFRYVNIVLVLVCVSCWYDVYGIDGYRCLFGVLLLCSVV